ncbi:MAG: hypothetical protein HOP34_17160 [Methylococcaceae bacterium]|nr:hypothetical protein [Methylococcaceae bacterium]
MATAFGLTLHPELQGKIPPFRDTYQTAIFFATQKLLRDRVLGIEQVCENPFNIALNLTNKPDSTQMLGCISHNNPRIIPYALDPLPHFSLKNCQLHNLFEIGRNRPIPLFILGGLYSTPDFLIEKKAICFGNARNYPLRLFEIGRNRPIPLPTENDTVIAKTNDNNEPKCSWDKFPECKTVQPDILATLQIEWGGLVTKTGMLAVIVALSFAMSHWVRSWILWFLAGILLSFLHCLLMQAFFHGMSFWIWAVVVFCWVGLMGRVLHFSVERKFRDSAMHFVMGICMPILFIPNFQDNWLLYGWVMALLLTLVYTFNKKNISEENEKAIVILYFVTVASIVLFLAETALPRLDDQSSLWSLWMPLLFTIGMARVLNSYDELGGKEKRINASFYFGGGVGLAIFMVYCGTSWWNNYNTFNESEPFYWLEGLSAWPSQLLRLSVILFAGGFVYWGHNRIQKMHEDLQLNGPHANFSLPRYGAERLGFVDACFIGNWKLEIGFRQRCRN